MARKKTTAKSVMPMVRKELDNGLRARDRRQLRASGILSTSWPGARKRGFFEAPCLLSAAWTGPLGDAEARPRAFSTFLLSSVSEWLVTSDLAEVKLLFFSWPR